jgi:hypothetical protein
MEELRDGSDEVQSTMRMWTREALNQDAPLLVQGSE